VAWVLMGDGKVVGFFHAGVTVQDMHASLRFYRDLLGLELISRSEVAGSEAEAIWNLPGAKAEAAFLRVPGSDALIELFEFEGVERHGASARPPDYGAGHFCLYVDDAAAIHARLVKSGFGARSEAPVEITASRLAGSKVLYAIDPDGYHVELIERPRRKQRPTKSTERTEP
jgi:catechol 2,3-dioxygenase-like lactoylglutathione lyase family enzyme